MTYTEWSTDHKLKRAKVQRQLEGWGLSQEEVIDYFDYDNMAKNQPKFCGLYKTKARCHTVDKLNCYQCGCPYFKYTDSPTPNLQGKKRFSSCSINSKFSKAFELDGNIHCDCTGCTIPHTTKSARANYEVLPPVNDSCSFLEHLRATQLWDIFGRLKLF